MTERVLALLGNTLSSVVATCVNIPHCSQQQLFSVWARVAWYFRW